MATKNKLKILLLLALDVLMIITVYILAFYIRYSVHEEYFLRDIVFKQYLTGVLFFVIIPIYIISLASMKMYTSIWSIAGFYEAISASTACTMAFTLNLILSLLINGKVPFMVNLIAYVGITITVLGSRLSLRVVRRFRIYSQAFKYKDKKKVLIIGAGSCGGIIIDEIKRYKCDEMTIVGVIDDDFNKFGTFIHGIKVLGNRNTILKNIEKYGVEQIIFAIAALDLNEKKEILNICNESNIEVKVIPGIFELIDGKASLGKIRDVDLKDLLGREEVALDKSKISSYIKNKTILVTGGGGSIGSELCRQIAKFNPKKLVILDIYENNAYDLQTELNRTMPNLNKDIVIASVRDIGKMTEVFKGYKPEIVFHAAAHKHVPLMEFAPSEAIKNNILGTYNSAKCAHEFKAESFVLISTDKAVNPTNVMGASKRMCEMVIQAYDKVSETKFVAVRFGNVLGSNGSVVPLFKKQISSGGPVTLTHKEITRYFMLIPEAAQLVLQAGALAEGGEIFVLDMGQSVKIYDLAKKLIKLCGYEPHKDIKIEITGLRPGEKLYEELLMREEGLTETSHEKIFVGKPGEFNLKELKKNIARLLNASATGNKEFIKETLKEIVPTYKDAENIEIKNIETKNKEGNIGAEEVAATVCRI